MKSIFYILPQRAFLAAFTAAAALLCACSSKPVASTAAPTPDSPAKTAPKPSEVAVASGSAPRSVFSTDQSARDPFFPKAKRTVAVASAGPSEVAVDVPSLLQANFQGVISSGGKAIAVINNVMLEAGRTATIPIRAGGVDRQIAVRCREVSRGSVVLEVQGYPQPVRIVPKTQ